MEFMPIFSAIGSLGSLFGGGDEEPAPAPAAREEKEIAGTAENIPASAQQKQRESIVASRNKQATGSSTMSTRSGLSVVGSGPKIMG